MLRDQRVVDAQRHGRPEPVGVEAPGEYRALGEVAVHVAGEQGRGEQQRRGPGRRGARELGTRGRSPSPPPQRDARPRQDDERDSGVGDGEGDRRVAARAVPPAAARPGDSAAARRPRRARRQQQQRSGQAEPPHAAQPVGSGRRHAERCTRGLFVVHCSPAGLINCGNTRAIGGQTVVRFTALTSIKLSLFESFFVDSPESLIEIAHMGHLCCVFGVGAPLRW